MRLIKGTSQLERVLPGIELIRTAEQNKVKYAL
jgi:hypothetical protein